jgi:hypothetical protein
MNRENIGESKREDEASDLKRAWLEEMGVITAKIDKLVARNAELELMGSSTLEDRRIFEKNDAEIKELREEKRRLMEVAKKFTSNK